MADGLGSHQEDTTGESEAVDAGGCDLGDTLATAAESEAMEGGETEAVTLGTSLDSEQV